MGVLRRECFFLKIKYPWAFEGAKSEENFLPSPWSWRCWLFPGPVTMGSNGERIPAPRRTCAECLDDCFQKKGAYLLDEDKFTLGAKFPWGYNPARRVTPDIPPFWHWECWLIPGIPYMGSDGKPNTPKRRTCAECLDDCYIKHGPTRYYGSNQINMKYPFGTSDVFKIHTQVPGLKGEYLEDLSGLFWEDYCDDYVNDVDPCVDPSLVVTYAEHKEAWLHSLFNKSDRYFVNKIVE